MRPHFAGGRARQRISKLSDGSVLQVLPICFCNTFLWAEDGLGKPCFQWAAEVKTEVAVGRGGLSVKGSIRIKIHERFARPYAAFIPADALVIRNSGYQIPQYGRAMT